MGPEVRQLQYFVAVAEELHFTRAAERLSVVQQSLSSGIAQLEGQLGIKLFERTTRNVRLTESGTAWLPHARAALAAIDRAAEAAEDLAAGRTGRLRVGLATVGALALTPGLMRAFRRRYPAVALEKEHFDFRDPRGGLRDARTDVAIVRPPFVVDGLRLSIIVEEPRYVVLAADHRLAARAAVDFAEIADEPWMDADADADPVWTAFWRVSELRVKPPVIGAMCRSLDDLFEAARARTAAGLVPESVARAQSWPGLTFVAVRDVSASAVAVAWRADDDRAMVRNFVDLATELARTADSAPQSMPS